MDYRREIDGLRALAVVPVILFHAGFQTFSGGFVGVDVFFVISGYLITTIILAELEQGKFSIVNFYERRARRILPALFLVILACLPFAWLWLLPSDMKDFSQSVAAVTVFASNILFWRESGYFDTAAELKPLLHTWSLAVEEQYYVLFPVFLLLTWRLGKRWVLAMLAVIAVVSLALAHWGSTAKPAATFFLLPTRGWELLIGAFVAFHFSNANRWQPSKAVSEAGSVLGLALLTYAIFAYSKQTPFPSLYALVPTVGTALIILLATQETLVGRLLGNKVFVGIGLISYSAYLFHQPMFAFARHRSLEEPSQLMFGLLAVGAVVLAYFSWRFVETPFRRKQWIVRKQVFFLAAATSTTFAAIGLVGHFFNASYENYWFARFGNEDEKFNKELKEATKRFHNFPENFDGYHESSSCRFNVKNLNSDVENKLRNCQKLYGSGTLILGDSHAVGLYGAVSARFQKQFLVGITNGGCRPHTPLPECQYENFKRFIQSNPKVFSHLIYEQAGFYLLLDKNGKKGSREMFRSLSYGQAVEGIKIDVLHIEKTYSYLRDLSKLTPVTWFLPRIEPHIGLRSVLKKGCNFEYLIRPNLVETFEKLDRYIENMVRSKGVDSIRTVSQSDTFSFRFPADFLTCNEIYWSDGDHLSASGEVYFGKRLPDDFLEFHN